MKPVIVFDVESIGLHGEGFAVGAVVVDLETGETITEFYAACKPSVARGTAVNAEWVKANVRLMYNDKKSPAEVRFEFWHFWQDWQERGAMLCADCAWPVEANFLSACIDENPVKWEWQGPYPLLDLSSMLWIRGVDPLTAFPRLPNEEPAHNPLNDARQSARILLEYYKKTG